MVRIEGLHVGALVSQHTLQQGGGAELEAPIRSPQEEKTPIARGARVQRRRLTNSSKYRWPSDFPNVFHLQIASLDYIKCVYRRSKCTLGVTALLRSFQFNTALKLRIQVISFNSVWCFLKSLATNTRNVEKTKSLNQEFFTGTVTWKSTTKQFEADTTSGRLQSKGFDLTVDFRPWRTG